MESQKLGQFYTYGFDKLRFDLPDEPLVIPNVGKIEFIDFNSTKSLDEADGVVIPQGIFESYSIKRHFNIYTVVQCEKNQLMERYKQINNMLKDNKWVCFLVRQMVDRVPQGYESEDISDIDLCKVILNYIDIKRSSVDQGLVSASLRDEFKTYAAKYGVAQTIFDTYYSNRDKVSALLKSSRNIVGFEYESIIFFLPFHSTKFGTTDLTELAALVITSILDYRSKKIIELPEWLNKFEFNAEIGLKQELEELSKKFIDTEAKLNSWKNFKSILTTSGENLKKAAINILENYFSLLIDPIDEGIEDAKLLDSSNNVVAFLEFKGTNKGIKRENINQIDSARERRGLDASTCGILIINNEMKLAGIDERLNTSVQTDHIKHARNMNVLIIRAIDLLYFMKHIESSNDRNRKFLNLINSGGGWLYADPSEFKILDQ